MSHAAAFDYVCTRLEERTSLNQLEARGTVRIALKAAGLEARHVTSEQMAAVLEHVLPGELRSRGIDDGELVCEDLRRGIGSLSSEALPEAPDAVFRRLGDSA